MWHVLEHTVIFRVPPVIIQMPFFCVYDTSSAIAQTFKDSDKNLDFLRSIKPRYRKLKA